MTFYILYPDYLKICSITEYYLIREQIIKKGIKAIAGFKVREKN